MTKILDLVPGWLYALVVCVLLTGLLAQRVQVSNALAGASRTKAALSDEKLSRSQENEARNRVALREAERVAALSSAHAAQQQENVHVYTEQKRLRAAADATHRTADNQLRYLIASASATAASGPRPDGDTAACRSAGDRSKLLGGLLEEAVGLAREGQDLIEQRDGEVTFLLQTVSAERGLCSVAPL